MEDYIGELCPSENITDTFWKVWKVYGSLWHHWKNLPLSYDYREWKEYHNGVTKFIFSKVLEEKNPNLKKDNPNWVVWENIYEIYQTQNIWDHQKFLHGLI